MNDIRFFGAYVSIVPMEMIAEDQLKELKNGPVSIGNDHSFMVLYGSCVFIIKDTDSSRRVI